MQFAPRSIAADDADRVFSASTTGPSNLAGVALISLLVDQFDLNQIVLRDLKVFGALSDRVGWERVIQLVESGQLRLKPLITHSFPLERGAEAFALVRHRADGVVKAVITS
jgi:threonine dehydrogenase-like Zn-dependent dehydrogenase